MMPAKNPLLQLTLWNLQDHLITKNEKILDIDRSGSLRGFLQTSFKEPNVLIHQPRL
jgi:hypothetical protein